MPFIPDRSRIGDACERDDAAPRDPIATVEDATGRIAELEALLETERTNAQARRAAVAEHITRLEHQLATRRSSEAHHEQLRAILHQLSEASPSVLWLIDYPSKQVVFVSEAYEAVFGRSRAAHLRDPLDWISALHVDDRDRVVRAFQDFAVIGAFEEEYRIVRPNGEVRWIRDTGRALRDAAGRVFRLAGVAEDITAQRAIQAQLRDAREAAESANRAKSEFLANMSHEIRTPMTAILGYTDLLADESHGALTTEQRMNYLTTIRRNGEHLLNVINDILDLSKIEAGRMTIEQVPTDIGRIVADVASLTRVRAAEKGIAFEIDYDSPLPALIDTDPTRVRQILINLLANAVKFTHQGLVRLIVRYRAESPGTLEFEVLDTGIGMPPEQTAMLYQPFTQGDTTTARRYGGTGLGLTICQRLAAMLGGGVRLIESAPDCGTHFGVRLIARTSAAAPAVDDFRSTADSSAGQSTAADTAGGDPAAVPCGLPGESRRFDSFVPAPPAPVANTAAQAVIAPDTSRPPAPLAGLRILYAEDGPDNQRLISLLLERAGARVQVVENGQLAVEAALRAQEQGATFDVVLMDMQMPVLDGYGATALLRSTGYSGAIIALTAHAMAGDRDKCLRAGCSDYATKPVDRQKLFAVIRRHASSQTVSP